MNNCAKNIAQRIWDESFFKRLVPIVNHGMTSMNNHRFAKAILSSGLPMDDLYVYPGNIFGEVVFWRDFVFIEIHEDTQIKQAMTMAKMFNKYLESGNFSVLLGMIDKRFGFYPYFKLFDLIPDEKKYELFLEVYIRQEYGFHFITERFIKELIGYRLNSIDIPGKNPGDLLTIYRGEGTRSRPIKEAFSWTLDKEIAIWFAKRFGQGKVYQATTNYESIVAFLQDREEQEVIVLPSGIINVTMIAGVTRKSVIWTN